MSIADKVATKVAKALVKVGLNVKLRTFPKKVIDDLRGTSENGDSVDYDVKSSGLYSEVRRGQISLLQQEYDAAIIVMSSIEITADMQIVVGSGTYGINEIQPIGMQGTVIVYELGLKR